MKKVRLGLGSWSGSGLGLGAFRYRQLLIARCRIRDEANDFFPMGIVDGIGYLESSISVVKGVVSEMTVRNIISSSTLTQHCEGSGFIFICSSYDMIHWRGLLRVHVHVHALMYMHLGCCRPL